MNLRDAITTAGRFCWKGKQNSPLKNIRFLPGQALPHRLYAHRGAEGVLIDLDEGIEVPNICLDGETLATIAKDNKQLDPPKLVSSQGEGLWEIGGVQIKGESIQDYPAFPGELHGMQWEACPDWWAVECLLHAVSKDKNRPDLACLRFTPEAVDATDRYRIARAFIAGKWNGLVSASLFKGWPRGNLPVEYMFGESLAMFRIGGDEMRLCAMNSGRFEKCEEAVTPHWDGLYEVVDTAELVGAVKKVKSLSERITFGFSAGKVDIAGGGFTNTLPAPHGGVGDQPVLVDVDAKQVFEAIKDLPTPSVRLGFTGPGDPLRIDSGPIALQIWGFTGG